MTVTEIQRNLASGELTSHTLVEMYLQQIETLDRSGPTLNSVIEVNPEALDIADALDRERREKGPRGPLHGIPVMLKDNIDTADQMQTTAGSLALEGSITARDSFVTQRLREAGAVILAKTNLSEWANFRSSRSTSGWSSRGGQTRNPYALDRNPCGSSSGSAVAVAANLTPLAVGTETDGSIICPSHINGIVGMKPTLGLISRAGIIPIAHSQDTAGPMTRTVTGAAILLGALTGVDPRDPATVTSEGKAHSDYTQFLNTRGLRGARIGVARNFFGFHDQVDQVMQEAIDAMRGLGAEIIDPTNIENADQLDANELQVLLYEFKADLNAYLSRLDPAIGVRSMADVIDFNERNLDAVMPYFAQEWLIKAQEKGPLTEQAYLDALTNNHRLSREEGIDATLAKYQLDAIIAPSGGPAWLTDLINGDPHGGGGSSSPAAVAGYPSITVPAGFVFGLPVGISFIGGAYQEPVLIKLAFAFEQEMQARRPPRFLPSVEL